VAELQSQVVASVHADGAAEESYRAMEAEVHEARARAQAAEAECAHLAQVSSG
jgi:hypothetical protein